MGMNDADSQWCPVLGTPGFQEYISIDYHARTTLQSFATYATKTTKRELDSSAPDDGARGRRLTLVGGLFKR